MKFNHVSLNFIGDIEPIQLLENNPSDIINPFAIISPHAGYIYSGDISASVFNAINKKINNVFIISTSHTNNYHGCSILNEDFETPYGNMEVDKNLTLELSNNDLFKIMPHYFKNDHTIDVILPFIKYKLNYNKIFPIMVGDYVLENLFKISEVLNKYLTNDNLFIISSDFSHYPSYDDAIIVDKETYYFIEYNDEKIFIENIFNNNYKNLNTRMCGWSSYLILLHMISGKKINIESISYKNSGDVFGQKDKVVGYNGITFNFFD